jgi:P-type E1-E2 ATPase
LVADGCSRADADRLREPCRGVAPSASTEGHVCATGQRRGPNVVDVARDGKAAGLVAIGDDPRETAAKAITALKAVGVRPVMLSGDNRQTAERNTRESTR